MAATTTLSDVLHDRWWIALLAFGVSIVSTPILRAVAYHARIVDRPDDLLKPHGRPVAYLGGVAMWLGLLAGLAAYIWEMPKRDSDLAALGTCLAGLRLTALLDNPLWNVFSIAAAATLVTAIGLVDDLVDLRPRKKVCGQVAAGLLLVVGGVGDRMVQVVLSPLHLSLPDLLIVPLSTIMCLVVVVAACNATNLLDGLDGLCGGVTGIIAVGFLALGAYLAIWMHYPQTEGLRIALCMAMVGAVLGFLPYNVPPASIFMGDAGSMLLGFFVATMMALFCQEGNARWFLAACVIFALPILDTALAVVRRARAGKSIFAGDRSHLYDQLVDRGMTVKQVVVLFYGLAILAGVLGVTVSIYVQGRYAVVVYGVMLLVIWAIFWAKGMIDPQPHQADRGMDSPDVAALARQLYRDAGRGRRFVQTRRDRICPLAPLLEQVPPGSSVLDVGCGAGLFVLLLAATGRAAAAIGADVDAAAIAAAERAARHLGELGVDRPDRFAFRHAPAGQPLPEGPFDVVSLIDVLHHVPPAGQRAFFAGAVARVCPGGIVLYKDMCRRPLWRAWANRMHDLLLARQWIHYVPLARLEAWAAEEGLEVLGRRTYQRLVYGHELLVMRKPATG